MYVAWHSDEFEDADLFTKYMRQAHYKSGYLRIPKQEKDLTEEAHELHARNKVGDRYGQTEKGN